MSRQTLTRFRFLLNLTSSASLPGGTFSYTWLSDGTKVSAPADDGSGHGVQKRYFGSFVFTSNTGITTDLVSQYGSPAKSRGRLPKDLA